MTKNNEKNSEIQEKKEKNKFSYLESIALKELGYAKISRVNFYINNFDGTNPNKCFIAESGSKEISIYDPLENQLIYQFSSELLKNEISRGDKIDLVDTRKVTIKNRASYRDGRYADSEFKIDLSISDLKELFNRCIQQSFDIFPDLLNHIFIENSIWIDNTLANIDRNELVDKEIDKRLNERLSDDSIEKIRNYEKKNGELSEIDYDDFDSAKLAKVIKVRRSALVTYREITGHEKKVLKMQYNSLINGLSNLLPETKKERLTEEKNKIKSNLLASLN